jgi:retron-type reverse transcriptase
MSISTWNSIVTGMREATDKAYMRKSATQRMRREVAEAWNDYEHFCQLAEDDLRTGRYRIGPYRHFKLKDRKKVRDISVLPFLDRCVQNDVKEAIEPVLLRYMTDDMMGGLPGRGVVASDGRPAWWNRCDRR